MTTSHARGFVASPHESALLHAAQRNDRRAQEHLLCRYEPLVHRAVARLRLPCRCQRGDIAQEARIGLLAAIRKWRPERGPFAAFAVRCVDAQVSNALATAYARKHRLLDRAVSLDGHSVDLVARDPAQKRIDRRCLLAQSTAPLLHASTLSAADPFAALVLRERLGRVLAELPALSATERTALTGVLGGKSYRQLAEQHGWSTTTVRLAACRARRKLRARELLVM